MASRTKMKSKNRAILALLIVLGGGFWFFIGLLILALSGGSEGHVAQKSDAARTVVLGIWLLGLVGCGLGLFRVLKPSPPSVNNPEHPPSKDETDKTNAG